MFDFDDDDREQRMRSFEGAIGEMEEKVSFDLIVFDSCMLSRSH